MRNLRLRPLVVFFDGGGGGGPVNVKPSIDELAAALYKAVNPFSILLTSMTGVCMNNPNYATETYWALKAFKARVSSRISDLAFGYEALVTKHPQVGGYSHELDRAAVVAYYLQLNPDWKLPQRPLPRGSDCI